METNAIYNMDNVKGLQEKVPDESIDLTVTSPPYDDLRTYDGAEWKFEPLAKEIFRGTKLGGVLVWITADQKKEGSESGSSFKQALYFKEIGFNLHDTMIWQKVGLGAVGDNKCYWQNFEYMFVLSKNRPKAFNPIEDRANKGVEDKKRETALGSRNKKGINTNTRKIDREQEGRRFNVWTVNPRDYNDLKQKHPATFPDQLARDHIKSWSSEGDIVLDPFMGSGTTAKMAKKLDRKYIGFEVNQEYCEIAERRVSEVQKELI